jgi:hypothetical protein
MSARRQTFNPFSKQWTDLILKINARAAAVYYLASCSCCWCFVLSLGSVIRSQSANSYPTQALRRLGHGPKFAHLFRCKKCARKKMLARRRLARRSKGGDWKCTRGWITSRVWRAGVGANMQLFFLAFCGSFGSTRVLLCANLLGEWKLVMECISSRRRRGNFVCWRPKWLALRRALVYYGRVNNLRVSQNTLQNG